MAVEDYPWLPVARCLSWLKVEAGGENADVVEQCRRAAADWCEDQRPDLRKGDPATFAATERIVQAGVMATARVYARKDTAIGLASYGEFAAGLLRDDPDVRRMLGRARPVVG